MRTAAVITVVAVTVLGAERARAGAAFLAPRHPHAPPVPGRAGPPSGRAGPELPTPEVDLWSSPALAPSFPTAGAGSSEVAQRWVAAMWTRASGEGPFGWLAQVADITSPGLAAQLRTALPTQEDARLLSSSVEIDGVYPDALDPYTVTVTCVAHLITTTGPLPAPCATTVTLTPGPLGNLVVAAVA